MEIRFTLSLLGASRIAHFDLSLWFVLFRWRTLLSVGATSPVQPVSSSPHAWPVLLQLPSGQYWSLCCLKPNVTQTFYMLMLWYWLVFIFQSSIWWHVLLKGWKGCFGVFFTVQLVTTEYLGSVNENIFVIWFFFKSQWNLFEIFFCSMCNKELIKSDRSVINSRLRCRPHHLSCARWDSCNIHHVATVPVTKA